MQHLARNGRGHSRCASIARAAGRRGSRRTMPVRVSAMVLAVAALVSATAGRAKATVTFPGLVTRNMELVAHFDDHPNPSGGRGYNSCWGYVHPDGREYAILGAWNGTAIYHITDPATAYAVAFVPGPTSVWRGMRAYREWVYVVTEGVGPSPAPGLQIIRMSDPEHPVLVKTYTGSFIRAHTLSVDTTRALLFLNGTRNALGLQNGMVIMSLADPENPVELVAWPGVAMNGVDSAYVHDSVPFGNRLYASCIYAGTMRVLDISDPAAPLLAASFHYPGGFTHSSAPDTSGRYQYICDEAPAEPVKVFDVGDLAAPHMVNTVAGHPQAVVHNSHVEGDTLYLANFSQGVRLMDISDPAHPAEFAWADSRPKATGYYYSVWNVCPYFPSRSVIASDMENGLFVYRPVRDFGILRVEVVDATSGLPLAGATVTLLTQGDSLVTPASGVARFGPNPGVHAVRVHKFGYLDQDALPTIARGVRDTVEIALVARPRAALSGVVRDAASGAPLAGAEVEVAGTALHVHTGDDGTFVLDDLPLDTYTIEVRCPGHAGVTRDIGVWSSVVADIPMTAARTYDPLETETGWQSGAALDNASDGAWVRVDPIGTGVQPTSESGATAGAHAMPFDAAGAAATMATAVAPATGAAHAARARSHADGPRAAALAPDDGGPGLFHELGASGAYPHPIQPEDDRTPPPGTQCYVTGQGTVPEEYWAGNVDGGRTTLITPPLDMTGMAEPTLAYWRWFYSDGDEADWMAVAISADDGATWTAVDSLIGIHNDWEEHVIQVADHVAATDHVRLRFEVVDGGAGSMVEGAIDDLSTYDAATVPLAVATPRGSGALRFRPPAPQPARDMVRLQLEMPRAGAVTVEVLDVAGRRVRRLKDGEAPAGLLTLRWDGSDAGGHRAAPGLYFARATSGAETAVAMIVRVE